MTKCNQRRHLHLILSARKVKTDLPGNGDSLLHQANVLGQIFPSLTKSA